jgi:glycosyltransferase involved in cell wall biosynthesis
MTALVNDKLVTAFDIRNRGGKIETLLFLSRIEERKGVFVAIKAFNILKEKYSYLKMLIVGEGSALEGAKKFAYNSKINDLKFTGYVNEDNFSEQFIKSDLYLFPTNAGEGMPSSVLEAMAFGLPIITRPVGGLCDFFENGKMGDMLDSLEPIDFARSIEKYVNDGNLTKSVSIYNNKYATENFLASNVVKKIEAICKIIGNR